MALALMRCNRLATLKQWRTSIRLISTSSAQNSAHDDKSFSDKLKEQPIPDFSIESVKKSKNWISYGYSLTDREEDRRMTRGVYFLGLSVCIIGSMFVWAYYPDVTREAWAQREAYLTLRDREEAGLEPIAPDYIDPSTLELPTDDELGDVEVII